MHNAVVSLLLLVALLALGACAAPTTGPGTVAGADPAALPDGGPLAPDTSCRVDADCAVRNVGNCCGYFPACINREARTDPEAVMAHCRESGMASVCGFREIQSCSCVADRCEAAPGPAPRLLE